MTIELKQFCNPVDYPSRYSLSEPFVIDGFEYATDARIAVRVKTDKPDTVGRNVPKTIVAMFNAVDVQTNAVWPGNLEVLSRMEDCECLTYGLCENCGKQQSKGKPHAPKSDESIECKELLCEDCNGTGQWKYCFPLQLRLIPVCWIAGRYYELLCKLPARTYALAPWNGMHAVRFSFDGGAGFLMPVSVDEEMIKSIEKHRSDCALAGRAVTSKS